MSDRSGKAYGNAAAMPRLHDAVRGCSGWRAGQARIKKARQISWIKGEACCQQGQATLSSASVTKSLSLPDENVRRELYRDVMPALENQDWNDHPDLFGLDPIYDHVVRERHGDRF